MTLPNDALDAYRLEAVAASASAEVLARLIEQSRLLGRSGLIADLAKRAHEARLSPFAEDHIRASAYAAASNDLIWERPPLAGWRPLHGEGPPTSREQREALAATLPASTDAVRRAARAAVAEFEGKALRAAGSAFDGAQQLPDRLGETIAIQASLWNDPRLLVTPDERVFMGETLQALQARREALGAISSWPQPELKKLRLSRFFRRRAHGSV